MTVVKYAEVGVLEVLDGGSDVVEDVGGGVLDVEDIGVVEEIVGVVDCEVDEVKETVEEVDVTEEDEDSVEVAVGVGLLLAIELDDDCTEELVGVEAAWEDVADVEETPVSVLVELEDIVNRLNLRSLGRLFIAKLALNVPYSSSENS